MLKGFLTFLEKARIILSIGEFILSAFFLMGSGVAGYAVLNPFRPLTNLLPSLVWVPVIVLLFLTIKSPFKASHHPAARWVFALGAVIVVVLLPIFGVVYAIKGRTGDIWTALAWTQFVSAFLVMVLNVLTKWEPLKRLSSIIDFASTFLVVLHSGMVLVAFNSPVAGGVLNGAVALGWVLMLVGTLSLMMVLFQRHHWEGRIGATIIFLLTIAGFIALRCVIISKGFSWDGVINLTTGSLSLMLSFLIIIFSALLPVPDGTTPLEAAQGEGEGS